MPRNRASRKAARSMNAGARIEIISGRTLLNSAIGSSNFPISPAVYPRALAIADNFQFYRFTKYNVTISPFNAGQAAIGYVPGSGLDTNPVAIASILELPVAVLHGGAKTTDTVLRVPKSQLLTDAQIPWFKTIPGTPDTQFEIQGTLYSIATIVMNYVVDWTMEVQSWNLAGNSPFIPKPISSVLSAQTDDEKNDRVLVNGQFFKLIAA